MKRRLPAIDPNIWIIVLLSAFAWMPLLTPAYFFEAHDARHSIFFLVEFDQTWRDGYLWPRWSPDFAFGYGYSLFNLYAPLAFYAAEILHLLGLEMVAAVKMLFALATVGAGLSMYLFTRRLYGRAGGLLAGIVYMFVPFHLAEIYVRAAFAEYVALALLPLILLVFTELIAAPALKRLTMAGLFYGLLALTHHTSFFTFTLLLIAYILFLLLARLRSGLRAVSLRLLAALSAGLVGLALAAIYLLPMLAEVQFVRIEQWQSGSYDYLKHFVYFSQLLSPFWGYGFSGEGLLDDMPFQLGLAALGLVAFAVVKSVMQPFAGRGVALFFLIVTIALVWLMSPLATPAWKAVPLAALVQFPWRSLTLTMLTMAVRAGALLADEQVEDRALRVDAARGATVHEGDEHSGSRPDRADHSRSGAYGQRQRYAKTLCNSTWSTNRGEIKQTGAYGGRCAFGVKGTAQSPLVLLSLVVVLISINYTLPQYTAVPDWADTPLAVVNWDRASIGDRVGMVAYTREQPQTSPMELQYLNGEPLTVAGIIAGEGRVETLRHGGASDEVRGQAETPVTLQFYTYDYPGWRVTSEGRSLEHRHDPPYGLITVDLPPGGHHLVLRMGTTLPRILGGLISGLTLGAMIVGPAVARRLRQEEAAGA